MHSTLSQLTDKKLMAGQPAQVHIGRLCDDIFGELQRRQFSEDAAAIVVSPLVTHLAGEMLAYWLHRYKGLKTGYSSYHSSNKSHLLFAVKNGRFVVELKIYDVGALKRSESFDEAIERLHKELVAEKSWKTKPYPSGTVSQDLFEIAERIQLVLVFAQMTGTNASFEWSCSYGRLLHIHFDREWDYEDAPVSKAKESLLAAVTGFEKMAKLPSAI